MNLRITWTFKFSEAFLFTTTSFSLVDRTNEHWNSKNDFNFNLSICSPGFSDKHFSSKLNERESIKSRMNWKRKAWKYFEKFVSREKQQPSGKKSQHNGLRLQLPLSLTFSTSLWMKRKIFFLKFSSSQVSQNCSFHLHQRADIFPLVNIAFMMMMKQALKITFSLSKYNTSFLRFFRTVVL